MSKGFALVLMQMSNGFWGVGGTWMTAATGMQCSDDASAYEYSYAIQILDKIKENYIGIDTGHVYVMGFSSGSIPATYIAMCLRTSTSYYVPAWTTHGSGLFEDKTTL